MLLPLRRFLIFFLFACAIFEFTHAAPTSTLNSSVRALGMGDAFTAIANDGSALFYNPAGLAKVGDINWKVFGLKVGGSGVDALDKAQDFKDDDNTSTDDYADLIEEFYGENASASIGLESIFSAPFIAFGYYSHTDLIARVDNPVYPEVYLDAINDVGYTAGLGFPLGPFMQAGFALKYIKRMGTNSTYRASTLADLDKEVIVTEVTKWGKGYGADVGLNFVAPLPIVTTTFAVTWKNIGDIKFTSDNLDQTMPKEESDLTLGIGVLIDTPIVSVAPAIDFRYLNRADLQLTRKVNFGVEIDLPIVDLRAGFREGYYTAGAGVDLGLFKVEAATYGVELGNYPGQIEDRRYVAEFSMELGVGIFSSSGSSDSSGGKSKSLWGGRRRLKQRR